jgi:flagellar biosynthesis/type III secretory pathway protein FliH
MTIAEEMRQLGLKEGLTIAEEARLQGREQGLQQGRQEGLQQGLHHGQRALFVELLRTKFGSIDEQVIQQLNAADESALRRYAQRILSAATLMEVFANEV